MRAVVVRIFCACALALCFASHAQGQGGGGGSAAAGPDLSGDWVLDYGKSNVRKPADPNQGNTLKIVQAGPEVRMSRTYYLNGQAVTEDRVYYTDGRGETNPGVAFVTDMRGGEAGSRKEVKSRTRWSGKKLVTSATLSGALSGRPVEYEMVDEWKLSSDGKTLTETNRFIYSQRVPNSIYVPANAPDTKRVYRRAGG